MRQKNLESPASMRLPRQPAKPSLVDWLAFVLALAGIVTVIIALGFLHSLELAGVGVGLLALGFLIAAIRRDVLLNGDFGRWV